METAQEREVFQLLQGRQAWPFHMMATATATGCLPNYSSSSCSSGGASGDCFVLGWEQQPLPPLGFFGALAADVNELFPLCTYQPVRRFVAPTWEKVISSVLWRLQLRKWSRRCCRCRRLCRPAAGARHGGGDAPGPGRPPPGTSAVMIHPSTTTTTAPFFCSSGPRFV